MTSGRVQDSNHVTASAEAEKRLTNPSTLSPRRYFTLIDDPARPLNENPVTEY